MSSRILKSVESFPVPIGSLLAKIPFSVRPGLGKFYREDKIDAVHFLDDPTFSKKDYLFKRLKNIVEFSEKNIPFYSKYYKENGFSSNQLKTLDDVKRIPVVNKTILREAGIENTSYKERGRFIANTGGSSGTPFTFYLSSRTNSTEWAHMHLIWEKLGYRQDDLYLSIIGRTMKNIETKYVCYDALRHRFLFNIYVDYNESTRKLLKIAKKYPIKYLHGYPGSIYDYAKFCSTLPIKDLDIIRSNLKGIFLGSEYPAPIYRDTIEHVFKAPTVSWYGHSERVVLAWEKEEKFVYWPFQTYGFTEAVPQGDGGFHLVGTSYENKAFPFIRYDTEDLIEPIEYDFDGILRKFKIKEARSADFLQDKKGRNISLTALFFGRHHKIFDVANHVQFEQHVPGIATLYITTKKEIEFNQIPSMFCFNDIDIDFNYKIVDKPIRTKIGKIPLKINLNN